MRARGIAAALLLLAAAGPALADRRADLKALREAIEESRQRVADYEQRERGLFEAVEALDRASFLLSRDVGRARRDADEAERELRQVRAEAQELAGRLAVTRRAMKARAVALYRTGDLGVVRVLFSADGLPEFLARVSALRRLLDHDAELLERHEAQAAALASAEQRARASAERLAAARAELEQRSAALEGERGRKRRLVARLHADRTRERAALVELEKAARALEETLASLGAEPAAGSVELPGPPFLTLRRHLPPPVDAPIVRGFGVEVDPRDRTETFHSGVDFEAPRGTPVRAVAAASVRFAGWFRGYGRMAILDHGDGYFSVCGHLDELGVEVGDRVAAGEPIGTVGETGSLAGPRLYFEIRRGAEALDPGDWLRSPSAG
jgi:septal ring factor EnvC (AmiA/AmiB activator)